MGMRAGIYNALTGFMSGLSIEANARIGSGLGRLFWMLLRGRREIAVESIMKHLGLERREAERVAKASFISNARSFLEIFIIGKIDRTFLEQRCVFEDYDVVRRVAESGRPVVIITGHLGAWEINAGISPIIMTGQSEVLVVVRKAKDQDMHEMMVRLRGAAGIRVVGHRRAAPIVLRALAANGACAFLADHNCSSREAIFLPFLGEVAAVNFGPALLAIRAEAVVLPGAAIRMDDGRYWLVACPPLDTRELTGSKDEKIRFVTEYYNRELERLVRTYPEQWFWMHKRWKTRPESEKQDASQD